VRIRAADECDFEVLQDIEIAAGAAFRDIGMSLVADDDPFSIAELSEYQRAGRAWVVVDDADRPCAYLLTDLVDGDVYIEQLSVHPSYARRGIGRQLLEHVAVLAKADQVPALTLTTFAQVPWNGPYYERCGFHVLDENDWTPGLRAIREREAAHGLDRWPRVCMRREL